MATVRQLSHNNTAFYPISHADVIKVNGETTLTNKLNTMIAVATCGTSASTSTKTVSINGYGLTTNGLLFITMTNNNTAQSDVKLQVGSNPSNAKTLLYNELPVTDQNTWGAGEVLQIYYSNNVYHATKFVNDGTSSSQVQSITASNVTYTDAQNAHISGLGTVQATLSEVIDEVGDLMELYPDNTNNATAGQVLTVKTASGGAKYAEWDDVTHPAAPDTTVIYPIEHINDSSVSPYSSLTLNDSYFTVGTQGILAPNLISVMKGANQSESDFIAQCFSSMGDFS